MQILVTVPDEIAEQLIPQGQDAGNVLLKLSGLRAYSEGRISERTLQVMLGLDSIFDVHALLKEHLGDEGQSSVAEVERELSSLKSLKEHGTSIRTA